MRGIFIKSGFLTEKAVAYCCGIRRKPGAGMDLDIKWKARDEDTVSAHW